MLRVLQICKASVVSAILAAFAVAAVGSDPPAQTRPSDRGAFPPVNVSSFGRLPLTFEKNTGRYDKRVQFLTRTGGATVFITRTETVMVLRGKARGEGQEATASVRRIGSPAPSGGRGSGGGGVTSPSSSRERVLPGSVPSATGGVLIGSPPSPLPPPAGGGGGNGPLTARGGSLSALSPQPSAVLRMKLVGANAKAVATGLQKQPGIVNYFIGNDPKKWRTRVPTYAKAKLAGVYPGVDVVYYGQEARGERQEASDAPNASRSSRLSPLASCLEYDFVVKPGADPRRIELAFEGADRIRVADGDLILSTPAGEVRMKRPYAYQVVGGRRVQVACDYKLSGQRAALRLARYDATRPLVVDPALLYSSLLGGGTESGCSLHVEGSGAAYVSGFTRSAAFPRVEGSYGQSPSGARCIFVTKFHPSGGSLVYSSIIGETAHMGNSTDQPSLGVDVLGHAYVAWMTRSADFPTTPGAITGAPSDGSENVFVAKLSASGDALAYSTCIGGPGRDYLTRMAVAPSGHAFVACVLSSTNIHTPGAYEAPSPGAVYVAKVNQDGTAFEWAARLWDYCTVYALAADAAGRPVFGGETFGAPFPSTPDAFVRVSSAGRQGFVFRLAADGTRAEFATLLSPSTDCVVYAVTLDPEDHPIVAGSASVGYPATLGAYQRDGDGAGLFITKLTGDGSALLASSRIGGCPYLGGPYDWGWPSLATDAGGNVVYTNTAVLPGLPVTDNALQPDKDAGDDFGIICMSHDLSVVAYGSYLGGDGTDAVWDATVDTSGAVWCVGTTGSAGFPLTPDAFQTSRTNNGPYACIVRMRLPWPTKTITWDSECELGATIGLRARVESGTAPVQGATVSFASSGTALGSATTGADGNALLDLFIPLDMEADALPLLASFAGNESYLGSDDLKTLTVRQIATASYTLDRIGTIGELTILRGYLSRTSDSAKLDGKTVEFSINGTLVGTAVTGATGSSGRADLNWIITDGPATRTILAQFAGDASHTASSGTATLTARTWQTKMNGVDREGRITAYRILKAWLWKMDNSPVAGKGIAFKLDGTLLGTDNTRTTGLAQVGYTIADGAGAGTRSILAEWAGDGGYLAASCTNTLTVLKATPYIWVMPRSVPEGGVARLYAYFRRLADYQKQVGKTVSFRIDGTWIADAVTGSGLDAGIARHNYTTIEPPGGHTIRCEFAGDAWVDAGYGEGNLTIY